MRENPPYTIKLAANVQKKKQKSTKFSLTFYHSLNTCAPSPYRKAQTSSITLQRITQKYKHMQHYL